MGVNFLSYEERTKVRFVFTAKRGSRGCVFFIPLLRGKEGVLKTLVIMTETKDL